MAKKTSTTYVCEQCGASSSKWSGRCSNCGSWNSLIEQLTSGDLIGQTSAKALQVVSVGSVNKTQRSRKKTGISDLDAVLGSGLVDGSCLLVAGQPGAGKSTLLLQLAGNIAVKQKVLYISAEESDSQIANRAKRLGVSGDNLLLAASTNADDIAATIASGIYDLVIVDSIQTIKTGLVASGAGSVSQITNSAHVLINIAKQTATTLLLVGHITKEGYIAGPKVLEHLVDVVLQLEVESQNLRILRAHKNRYGPTTETAVFEMGSEGLSLLDNPSAFFLSERTLVDGSVVLATIDGTRPLLIEVQALVNKTSFGYPKRTAVGFDINRLNILVAVLSRRTKLDLQDKDIYINVVGGLRLNDPGSDLAVAMAIASATTGYKLDEGAVVFGEIGLGGEIRSVTQLERRIAEAKQMGFRYAIGPQSRLKDRADKSFMRNTRDVRSALVTYMHQ